MFMFYKASLVMVLSVCLVNFGCTYKVEPITIDQTKPKVAGIAIVTLIDTSGSMTDSVPNGQGKKEPKYKLAKEAMQRIVGITTDYQVKRPYTRIDFALFHFSGSVHEIMGITEFTKEKVEKSIAKIPEPDGGTAIGLAIHEGFKELYKSPCDKKYLICVTDGDNTWGPSPESVMKVMFEQTKGEVTVYFVAFDTSAIKFAFLKDYNGHAIEAKDGAQLNAELSKLYQEKILNLEK